MTAVNVALVRARTVEQTQWLTPAPLWNNYSVGAASSGLTQPWIAELRSDTFVQDFLGLVGGSNGASPDALASTTPHLTVDESATGAYRLFQPLSQCYYLVSASLVCRRPGIPDHRVGKGERTTFVMRRLVDGAEQAWVPAGGHGSATAPPVGSPPTGSWLTAPPDALVGGEEQFPLHAAAVAPFAAAGTTAATLGMAAETMSTRTLFYGYVPVGRRERMVPALADPLGALNDLTLPPGVPPQNPFLDELMARVVIPWSKLTTFTTPSGTLPSSFPNYPSLYVLLDLADWVSKYLPSLQTALTSGSTVSGALAALRTLLQQTTVRVDGSPQTLWSVLGSLQPFLALVTGADIAGPTVKYDLSHNPIDTTTNADRANWFDAPKQTPPRSLADYARDAMTQERSDPAYHPDVPPELQGLIKDDPISPPPGTPETTYVIRAVFEHDPCAPVLSAPTHPFVLARAMDAQAPARKIRIQLPDISNMRQFNRGVALEMPPSLRRVIDAVTPDVLKGDPVDQGGLALGMICSFSLQIIFICAFVVLFIFLLLLNIVFWWMPFLKICFPIPVKTSASKSPPL